MDAETTLKEIAEQTRTCERCGLAATRKNAVPGTGPCNARVMLIGEGPGYYENEQGKPFVGPAGHFLDDLLASGGLKRSEVFITNVVKCRPPGNRDPQEDELTACREYLDRQLEAIQPDVIVTLGRFSMARYFKDAKISMVHGKAAWIEGKLVVPMYHPAAGLHQPNLKATILHDFAQLPGMLEKADTKRQASTKETPVSAETPRDEATQLSFF